MQKKLQLFATFETLSPQGFCKKNCKKLQKIARVASRKIVIVGFCKKLQLKKKLQKIANLGVICKNSGVTIAVGKLQKIASAKIFAEKANLNQR